MKRYASKERFLKILDQIASTAMKESIEFEKGGESNYQYPHMVHKSKYPNAGGGGVKEASNWIL